MCVAILLQKLWERYSIDMRKRRYCCLALVFLVYAGLWDQYPRIFRPDFRHVTKIWKEDAAFVAQIEKSLPPGAMVYQLPFMEHPEAPALVKHHSYFAIRFYLHSNTLRWSGGAMKGRETSTWQKEVAALPLDDQLQAIAQAGFLGIQVSRDGYVDQGAELERALQARLGPPVVVSENGRDVYYSLQPGQVGAARGEPSEQIVQTTANAD